MYIIITVVNETPTDETPSMNCLALVYKKCLSDKVMMNLTAIQDMGHLKKVKIIIAVLSSLLLLCL